MTCLGNKGKATLRPLASFTHKYPQKKINRFRQTPKQRLFLVFVSCIRRLTNVIFHGFGSKECYFILTKQILEVLGYLTGFLDSCKTKLKTQKKTGLTGFGSFRHQCLGPPRNTIESLQLHNGCCNLGQSSPGEPDTSKRCLLLGEKWLSKNHESQAEWQLSKQRWFDGCDIQENWTIRKKSRNSRTGRASEQQTSPAQLWKVSLLICSS